MVDARGKYFYDAQELAMDPKYIDLGEWENSIVLPLVAFVRNRGKTCIQCAL